MRWEQSDGYLAMLGTTKMAEYEVLGCVFRSRMSGMLRPIISKQIKVDFVGVANWWII
jgi:hypothetical protein